MRIAFLLITAGTLGSCAAISSPEGGARDTTLPKLISATPANGARNVTGQSIRLEFSEQVQLTDLAKNLLVAPVLDPANTYKIREDRTSVTLTFEQPFRPNTTYSFNFGDAISDITEKNKAANVSVSFSTGAQLDSGAVRGSVVGLLSQQPAEGVSVLLYPEADTSDIKRGVPTYLARTDKQGDFAFRYLKEGRYRAYALADKNQTNRYEEPEAVAYRPGGELLTVGPTPDTLRFVLTKPDSRRPLITTQKNAPTDQRISYNEGLLTATLAPLGSAATPPAALQEAVQLTERNRTAVLYRTAALTEGRYLLAATDSAGNVARDTIAVKFAEPPPKAPKPVPAYTVEGSPREVYRQGQVKFVFTEPIRFDPKKPIGTLVEDSLKRRPLRLPQDGSLSPDRTTLALTLDTKARKTVTLQLDSTAIQSITGRPLGLQPLKLRVVEQTTTGTLSGPIQTTAKRYWVQLLDEKGLVLQLLDSPKGSYRFDNLTPATYRLRVLIDGNQDGRWQGGDPDLKAAPEPVFLFPKPLTIRSNFDNVETLSF
ncbi:Ig-like domain-containing protein [Hymenobacter lapidiphilus]|uniref:Ig-like domain-containing protein n=1 Tax=Hymenobacter lapidiphilus TaxID=2608003 RepID=A0A7Y7PPE7_9BACT|nr:Ig-like domain-containing protein [Hymenobacter lapidiphilus]NVO31553.1 Ig-like domain-containing protein [Hymenobacter lapidiphilus]